MIGRRRQDNRKEALMRKENEIEGGHKEPRKGEMRRESCVGGISILHVVSVRLWGEVKAETDRETETGAVSHTVARVVAGRTVFLLGRLSTLFHPGKDLLGHGRVGGQRRGGGRRGGRRGGRGIRRLIGA